MVKVKVCGITNVSDAFFCSASGADILGFIFWKKSPRYISSENAKKIIDDLNDSTLTAGVFLDESRDEVLDIASSLNLDILQFHGTESPAYCSFFKSRFFVIKTFFPATMHSINGYDVDACLFDVLWDDKQKGIKMIDDGSLDFIKNKITGKKVIISGGLNVINVRDVIRKISPYAVDVASGVELSPGKKNKELVKEFINIAKE